jgi:hypothetical protein
MSAALEAAGLLGALLVTTALVLGGAFSLYGGLWIALLLYTILLVLAWRRFGGGRHPCFLFLGMLMLFQLGRLIGYAFGATHDPFDVVVQTLIPIRVSPAASETTLFIVLLSAICIYATCAWNFRPVTLAPGWELSWLSACYVLLAVSFPFVLYKNYVYLQFVRSHGGYLAIFTDSQAIAESAGSLVRLMSLVAYNAFILVFLIERRKTPLAFVTMTYLSTSLLELAIGLRGKVFLFLLTLWFLRNLKTGKGFRLVTLGVVGVVASMAAVAISGFREMRTTAVTGPAAFVSTQGISMGVTQVAIEYRPLFAPHATAYARNELLQAFYPGSHFGQGELFDNDISVFLNAPAFKAGFGTGSSYLAEAWITGKSAAASLFAVIVASFLIGLALRWLHSISGGFVGAVAVAILLPELIYLPRAQMLSPLAAGLKNGIVFLLIVPVLWAIRWLLYDREPALSASAPSAP